MKSQGVATRMIFYRLLDQTNTSVPRVLEWMTLWLLACAEQDTCSSRDDSQGCLMC